MPTAASANTARQPSAAATSPLTVRATRMPINRPLITVPTTRPRSWSADSDELMGTMIWATTEVRPTTASAAPKTTKLGAAAATPRAAAVRIRVPLMRPRRSRRSPTGTSRARPIT